LPKRAQPLEALQGVQGELGQARDSRSGLAADVEAARSKLKAAELRKRSASPWSPYRSGRSIFVPIIEYAPVLAGEAVAGLSRYTSTWLLVEQGLSSLSCQSDLTSLI